MCCARHRPDRSRSRSSPSAPACGAETGLQRGDEWPKRLCAACFETPRAAPITVHDSPAARASATARARSCSASITCFFAAMMRRKCVASRDGVRAGSRDCRPVSGELVVVVVVRCMGITSERRRTSAVDGLHGLCEQVRLREQRPTRAESIVGPITSNRSSPSYSYSTNRNAFSQAWATSSAETPCLRADRVTLTRQPYVDEFGWSRVHHAACSAISLRY